MSIIGVTDNENNRWKRDRKNNKDRKEQWGTVAVVKRVRAKWFCLHLN